jgi:hypothetical protein
VRRRGVQGFGIVEALISLFIVGIILGVVARGYQALNRLQLASYQMSIRLELMSFLHRLSYEASSALTMTTSATGFSFQRVNPTLNLRRNQPAPARLPWPIPVPPPATAELLTGASLVTTTFAYDAASKEVRRTAFGATSPVAFDVGEFLVSTESLGRILRIQIRPSTMTAPVRVKALLPVIIP